MQFITFSVALLTAISGASAHITSISTPAHAAVGGELAVTLSTANYIQNWNDYSILFSVATIAEQEPFLGPGTIISNINLSDRSKDSTGGGSFEIDLFLDPSKVSAGQTYHLNAAVTSVVGASLDTFLGFFNTTFST